MAATTVTASYNSIWVGEAGVAVTEYPSLQGTEKKHYDVVVIGAGIFGCTAAYLLKERGLRVALLEARKVGWGTTGHSTAKLSAQQGTVYSVIAKQRGKETAKSYYDMNMAGIGMVETLSQKLKVDCGFERRSHTAWASEPDQIPKVQAEYDTCRDIGIDCHLVTDEKELAKELPPSLHAKAAVRFDQQAQFNSYQYCIGLCQHIFGDGSDVYENTRVLSVTDDSPEGPHEISLVDGEAKIATDHVVMATHLPISDKSMHFKQVEPSRAFCVAVRVADGSSTLHNMFINVDAPLRSLRTCENDSVVVVCGEGFKQGEVTATEDCYKDLEDWARTHFMVTEVTSRWSAMDYYSKDHVPFIGYLHRDTRSIYTATGFSKWGLAAGVTGGSIIADLIQKKECRFMEAVDACRWDQQWWKDLASHVSSGGTQQTTGNKHKRPVTPPLISQLKPGQGGVVRAGEKEVGAYRDVKGEYHVVEPKCTHRGCPVVFNEGDVVWDCTCHGSCFDIDGGVVHGPAVQPLCQLKDLKW
eukprot:jgi/Mesvir1/19587/Mv09889-RA.1